MKFLSKYRNHGFVITPTTRAYDPVHGVPRINQGLSFRFDALNRTFDTEAEQRERGWSDETREQVEDYLLSARQFGVTVFLAPGQEVAEEKVAKMRVKPQRYARPCHKVEVVDGSVVQCGKEATPGRDYCKEHDPEEAQILRGTVEQK